MEIGHADHAVFAGDAFAVAAGPWQGMQLIW
jgi:hypothetical protein